MNCKPGDLAIIIKTSSIHDDWLSTIVEVGEKSLLGRIIGVLHGGVENLSPVQLITNHVMTMRWPNVGHFIFQRI